MSKIIIEMTPFLFEDGNTYYRFYHLYKKSELEDEFDNTNYSYTSYESFYELGNWGIMCVKN
jgi:hypothetical protein